MTKRFVSLGVLAVVFGPAVLCGAQPGKDDAKKIQGVWVLKAVEKDGTAAKLSKEAKWTFGADQVVPENERDTAKYKLGVDKKLGTFDLTPTAGGDKGKTYRGLYELKGDTLTICIPEEAGAARPTAISSKGKCLVMVLKRDKP
jgi:uncharacterized protein (TIGR03067 family)